ncbi:MAG TPA: tetratricopeptide repeat protein [Cyclobacteriaceae bacterium]|nr:tetratricopeptide repeat protein [Cyclobacteriaceae bacterium]
MNKASFRGIQVFFILVTSLSAAGAPPNDSLRQSVDSLRQRLQHASGMERYELAFKIAYDMFDVDNPLASKYAEEAFEIAKDLGDSATIVRSGRIYGQLLWRVGRLQKAIDQMEWTLAIADRCGLEKDLRFLSNSLSIAYTYRGQYDKALQHNFKSLELRQQTGNKLEISIAQSNIGTTFYTIGIYDRAAEFLKKSLAMDSVNHYTPNLKISLALCYAYLNYLNESRDLIESVRTNYADKLTTHTLTRIELGLGIVETREGNFGSAEKHLKLGYNLAARDSNKTFMSDCLIALGQVYLATNNIESAEEILLRSESLSLKSGYRNGIESSNIALAKLYSLQRNHVKASAAKSKILAARDSSMNQQVIENIYRHQFDFYEKENTKTIATQSELLILKEQAIRHALILNIVLWTCASLLVAIALLLYRRNREKKHIALELEQKVHERTAALRDSVERLQRSELERNFLLDGITARLKANLATFNGLSLIAATYNGVPIDFAENIEKASDGLATVIKQVEHSKKLSSASFR